MTLNTRKLLGSDMTAEQLVRHVRDAVLTMDDDAEEMGVVIDWSSVILKVGDDYEYTTSYVREYRQPYLEIAIEAERKTP